MLADSKRDAICSNVARMLRQERNRQGLSLNALAQAAGLSRQTIRFVEREDRNPTLETLLRITEALGIKIEDVVRRARRRGRRG
jgi:DNA-binding XRE family transcriptional regulator